MIGSTVSHYKILEKLGEGGMGVVYKAQDTKLDRLVALKFLPSHLATSEQDKARFNQEAKAASAINHPNICTIYSVDEHETQLFIVMEFVNGQTLRDLAKGGESLQLKRSIEIGIQIADGLAAAHENGIVHRDIKPENIMVRKDGIAQIMDFGLAKLRNAQGVSRLTKEGSTVGTAAYMSPEQVQGQDADHRSDIFSLGVLLYELFAGSMPFKGVHETALMYEIVNVDAPPIVSIKPDIDPELDRIVLECMEKDPNERTQSVKQVSIDLKRFKRESGRTRTSRITTARRIEKPEHTGQSIISRDSDWKQFIWPVISGVLYALGLLVALWNLWSENEPASASMRFTVTIPKDQVVDVASFPALAISPDGSRTIYKADGKFYLKKSESFDPEPIAGTEDASCPFFSPDGRWLCFFSKLKLMKIPINGGAATVLTETQQSTRGATWGYDGTIIFSPWGRGGLMRIPEGGGEVSALTAIDTVNLERTHRWPHALPDGKTILYTVGTIGSPDYYEDATIAAVNLETGAKKVILKGASSAHYLPPGYLIYAHKGSLFAVSFDLATLEVSGSSFPVVSQIAGDVTTGANHFSISRNGTLVYLPDQANLSARMLTMIDDKGSATALPVPAQSYSEPRISPDGSRVVLSIQSGKDFDIWVYDIARNTFSKLTFGGANRSPVWSPDGRRIAYSNNTAGLNKSAGTSNVVIISADGSGTPEEILMNNDRTYVNSWSRDGSNLIVTVPQKGMGWDLSVVPLKGEKKSWTFVSTQFDEASGALSPDGKWLAYNSNETGAGQIYIRPFPNGEGKWQVSRDGGAHCVWSADGKQLYYDKSDAIMTIPVSTSSTLVLGKPEVFMKKERGIIVESGVSFDVLPGGKQVLIMRSQQGSEAPRINVVTNWFEEIKKTIQSGK